MTFSTFSQLTHSLDAARLRSPAEKVCKSIVSTLCEELIAYDEGLSCVNYLDFDSDNNSKKGIVAIVSTICVFASASPQLLVSHLDTILPYLKMDTSDQYDSLVCVKLCSILSSVVPILSKMTIGQIASSDVGSDLVQIVYKFDVEAISGAVKALSMISKVSERSEAKLSELDTTSLWCAKLRAKLN